MQGAAPAIIHTEIAIPDLRQCLIYGSPLLLIGALWGLCQLTEIVIHRLFPHWEWEKQLGWLNIRASKRADTALRWIGYFVHALLAVSLYGIVWAAPAFSNIMRWNEPYAVAEGAWQLSTLLICLGIWLVYFGWELGPKLRRRHEAEELEKFRRKQAELEEERGDEDAPRGTRKHAPSMPGPLASGRPDGLRHR
jgi:hypothetical protein